MPKRIITTLVFIMACTPHTWAGARIEINEKASIDVGIRIQALAISTDEDIDGDGSFESKEDFKLRRARLRLGATFNEYIDAFLQTDVGSPADGAGLDERVIDAFITLKPRTWAQLVVGQHMSPASRQNLTSSGALMAIDRPAINYKTLTWGTRAVNRFATTTFGESDAGLRGEADVRDTGLTLFGNPSLSDSAHLKYYLGVYDGIPRKGTDAERFTGRVQLNLFDAEPAYFNSSTYLGKKKTVGVGASYDLQSDVADTVDKGGIDYAFYTADVFADLPLGPGSVTLEAAYETLDLDDATEYDKDGDPLTAAINVQQSQGDGYYVQLGYYVQQWQPWVMYEQWSSDDAGGKGGFDSVRIGLTYYFEGQNANVKVGYEHFTADENIGATADDTIDTIVVGAYVTY